MPTFRAKSATPPEQRGTLLLVTAITAAAETDYRAYRGGLHVTFDWPAYVFQGSLGSLLYNHDTSLLGTNSK